MGNFILSVITLISLLLMFTILLHGKYYIHNLLTILVIGTVGVGLYGLTYFNTQKDK